tara:strand:+ start:12412 stop:14016 length:1605 start_codon:yes stop_codon:yes gene_type:complete
MPTFGYQQLYANGLNNNTQLRRSADMIYQRGANYNIIVTGDTYESSLELDVDLYSDATLVGRMQLVPFDTQLSGATYYYSYNLRPYDYISNYVQSEHFTYYWKNDWFTTNNTININNPYPNKVTANYKYGWRYINSTGGTTTEFTGNTPTNNLNHYTNIPNCVTATGFTASGFTNTGEYFDYVGGQFQMGENKFILPNFDQEIGTVLGTGLTINTLDIYRRLSPMSQYLMDYPTVPEMSETARFLTDAPRIQYIQPDENYVLYYLNGQSGDRQVIEADYAVFTLYDSSNTQLVTNGYWYQQLNFSGTTYASPTGYTDNLKPFALPCGPVDIQNLFLTGQTFDDVAYYSVQLYYSYPTNSTGRTANGPIGPVSETFYFYLYNNCYPENTRIAFLNSKGGYDYFTFKSYRQDTKKISTQSYDSRYFSTDVSGPDVNVGRTNKTFGTDVDREIVLESEFLSVPVAQWIEQLFMSPQVYEVRPNYISPMDRQDKIYWDLRPIQVLSTEVETITKKHRKLNKYRITFKSADTFFANRGF